MSIQSIGIDCELHRSVTEDFNLNELSPLLAFPNQLFEKSITSNVESKVTPPSVLIKETKENFLELLSYIDFFNEKSI